MAVTVSSPGAIGYGAIKTDRGTTMEMHQVRYFLAVARVLNFTRAADECNVTQPSLTRAIKQLEAELGGDLFRRERPAAELLRDRPQHAAHQRRLRPHGRGQGGHPSLPDALVGRADSARPVRLD